MLTALCKKLYMRHYTITSPKLKAPLKLAIVTDLHSTFYGRRQMKLMRAIARQAPDAVLLGGDIADDKRPLRAVEEFLENLGRLYPCFYVTGNHECRRDDVSVLKTMFQQYGVCVLEGQAVPLVVGGQIIHIAGLDDSLCLDGTEEEAKSHCWKRQLDALSEACSGESFNLLLTHRPERVQSYQNSGFDLVVSGHAHGGQVRLPGVNGLFAPQQGILPAYAGGCYDLGKTTLVVSRGLCKNYLPRIFNRPELVVVEVMPKEKS